MSADSSAGARFRRPRAVVLVASVLCAVSLVTAGFYGVSWAVAANDDTVTFATQRDEALRVGSQALVNFHTLNYRDVEHGLDLWEKSSTGALRQEIERSRKEKAGRIKEAKTSTKATILDAALKQLNQEAGTARLMAVVKVTVTAEGQQPVEQRARYEAQLKREGKQWKLSAIGTVPVG